MSTNDIAAQSPSAFKFFLGILSQFKIRVALLWLGEITQAVGLVLLPYAIRGLIDTANAYQAELHGDFFSYIHDNVLHFIYASLLIVFSSRLSGTALGFTVPFMRIPARQQLFDRLKNHSMNYFQNRLGGTFGSKINDTSAGIVFLLFIFSFTMLPLAIVFTASLYALFKMNTSIALIVVVWGLIYCLAIGLCSIPMARISQEMAKQRAYIAGRIIDVASNIATVKSYAHEDIEANRLNEDQKGETAAIIKYQFWREGLSWFHFLFGYGMLAFVMYVAMHSFEQKNLTVGSLSFIFTILLVLLDQIRSLSNSLRDFMNYIGQMRDGVQTIMQPPTIIDAPGTNPLTISEGRIEFREIEFVYNASEQQFSFNKLSVVIEPRQKIGLMGPSGAGKSTLASLLLRFYDLQGGQILIDGQDIRNVTQSSLRENIAIIPQDTSLFHRTMMENIRYGRLDSSDEEVVEAARKAHAHGFISKLPHGYETMVGERGVKLSGGQRQRIAIARAILKNAPILVLDEATSALDSASEKLIQDSLNDLMQGKTVIAIAHRLSTISSMDRLLVMENGTIIEDGTHGELVARDGHYAQMWALQSGGFLPE